MRHKFFIADAVRFGMEAAAIIYNIRFWLEKEKYRSVHEYNGKEYYWMAMSYEVFHQKLPYLNKRKIGNILRKLEKRGTILSAYFGNDYEKVKHYTIPSLY